MPEHEVVARAAADVVRVLAGDDEVAAEAAEEQVEAVAAVDDVVAVVALDDVVAAGIRDDVVAGAAADHVVAITAVEAVVAAVAVDRVVVRAAGHEVVVARGAADNDVSRRRCSGGNWSAASRIVRITSGMRLSGGARVVAALQADRPRELVRLVSLEDEGRRDEDLGRQMGRVGVGHHQLGERVRLELAPEVEARGPLQVVEAVAVLQLLHLGLEHEVEGGAQEAAEGHLLLGEAADPEVDVVDAGRGDAGRQVGIAAGRVQEGEAVAGDESVAVLVHAEDELHGGGALAGERGLRS